MLEFAQCMRDNGVPTFRDPKVNPDGTLSFQRQGADHGALESARQKCRPLLAESGLRRHGGVDHQTERQDMLLKFARCMREQGVDMPDPNPNADDAEGPHGLFGGLDPQSPTVQAAIKKCRSNRLGGHGPFGGGGG